mmetsp:Transcript_33150/g.65632  ORF Transcript_33150/g.65632 Transcript_33150/m.65632 type:complete len:266 (-) Transcript_33150:127-924(-)
MPYRLLFGLVGHAPMVPHEIHVVRLELRLEIALARHQFREGRVGWQWLGKVCGGPPAAPAAAVGPTKVCARAVHRRRTVVGAGCGPLAVRRQAPREGVGALHTSVGGPFPQAPGCVGSVGGRDGRYFEGRIVGPVLARHHVFHHRNIQRSGGEQGPRWWLGVHLIVFPESRSLPAAILFLSQPGPPEQALYSHRGIGPYGPFPLPVLRVRACQWGSLGGLLGFVSVHLCKLVFEACNLRTERAAGRHHPLAFQRPTAGPGVQCVW